MQHELVGGLGDRDTLLAPRSDNREAGPVVDSLVGTLLLKPAAGETTTHCLPPLPAGLMSELVRPTGEVVGGTPDAITSLHLHLAKLAPVRKSKHNGTEIGLELAHWVTVKINLCLPCL